MSDKKVFKKKPPEDISYNYNGFKLKGIAGLFSFSTILPLNVHTSIEEMASFTWFWPILGGIIGIFVGAVGFITFNLLHLPSLLSAALIYSFTIWFTGFHHLDGLMDMGDGLMVHGDPKKKMDVMKDSMTGTGGISLFFIVAIITFSSINSIPAALIFGVLLISEMAAKISLLSCATFSTPQSSGTGRYFINKMNPPLLLLSLVITCLIGFLLLQLTGVLAIIAALLGGILISIVAKKQFKYANGDILGASNEIGRAISLLVTIITLMYFIKI